MINLFYYADRFVIYILVEPIRADLGLTDGQMGLITGIAFSVSYVLLALPVGRLTDRVNRVHLLAVAVTVWCAFTSVCGLARSFWQMIFLRIGVASGEAGGFIPAQSLVADYYPPASRGRAMAVFMSSANIGKILAFLVAGFLNELIGWRWTFAVVGGIGLFLGPLIYLTVAEPQRGAMDGIAANKVQSIPPFRQSLSVLFERRGYVYLVTGYAVASIAHYSMLSWLPTFFMRRFDFATGQAGLVVSLAVVVPGLIGMVCGGYMSDKLFQKDPKWVARIPALALSLACPTLILQVYAPNFISTILLGLIPAFAVGVYAPPLLAGIQTVAGARMRGIGGAIMLMALLLVGQGIGPAVSGLLSDYFSDLNTVEYSYISLRNALAYISVLYVFGGMLLFAAGPYMASDIDSAKRFDQGLLPST